MKKQPRSVFCLHSARYERTSEVPLDGKQSQRMNLLELRDVPPGLYEITATLVGAAGRLARATRMVKVMPSPGPFRIDLTTDR